MAILLLLCFACSSQEQHADKKPVLPPVEISAQTDRTTATLSEAVTFTLSAQYDKGLTVKLPEVGTQIAGLRITDFGEEGPKEVDNRLVHKKWYKLQADIAGSYIIPAQVVSYAADNGTRELKTPQIFIEVKSLLKPGPDAPKDIIDIKTLEEVPFNWRPYIWAGCAAVVVISLCAGALIYYRKRKKKADVLKKPAHILALEELEKLKSEHLIEKGIVREHYFRLSDIFRRYIENRFSIPAVEQTTQELLPEIMRLDAMQASAKSGARDFLHHSDMVKFAKYVPADDEVTLNEQNVVRIIDETKTEEVLPQAETSK
ncbi:MAG: hypothetical protein JW832_17395 [Deltaproteobacteria bacterium]|nr:hypothetical protein [Deltaproteobacteria bacterium]